MKKGFTLAEVLITLGIIGIVAQATIPTLVSSYQNQVYTTKLKKFASTYQQGMMALMAKYDCSDLICAGVYYNDPEDTATASAGWMANADLEFRSVFKIVDSSADGTYKHAKYVKILSGGTIGWQYFNTKYTYQTADGALVWISGGGCITNAANINNFSRRCGWALVDVNGDNLPNQFGRDIFSWYPTNDGRIMPDYGVEYAKFFNGNGWAGSSDYWKNNNSCSLTSPYADGCYGRLVDESWKMNY